MNLLLYNSKVDIYLYMFEVKMVIDEIKEKINKLPLSEKLLLIEDIWDSILESNSVLPLPEWQKRELERRYREYKNSNQAIHSWNSVHDEIREKYK